MQPTLRASGRVLRPQCIAQLWSTSRSEVPTTNEQPTSLANQNTSSHSSSPPAE